MIRLSKRRYQGRDGDGGDSVAAAEDDGEEVGRGDGEGVCEEADEENCAGDEKGSSEREVGVDEARTWRAEAVLVVERADKEIGAFCQLQSP